MASKADLQAVLSRHIGAENGVAAEMLAHELGIEARGIRTLVSALREEGVAVCGHPKTGYYIAATAEELERTCQFLRSRAMHSLVLESKLRHVPLPELLGQMRLKT